jgi:SAM-dependent methyltransferase
MGSTPLESYKSPATHESVSRIIRAHSTNPLDIREAALNGLDLSGTREVLDLGCGFGFMSEVLARRIAADARITGVDEWSTDETPFLQRVRTAGRAGAFVCSHVDSALPWADRQFDLIVCCYSLYFFVEVLPEVARTLAPDGVFVAVTHSEANIRGQLPDAGLGEAADGLLKLTRRFSAENGGNRLKRWFGQVERVDYPNALVFEREHAEELMAYLRFKLPILIPDAPNGSEALERLERYCRAVLMRSGRMIVDKSDAVFRCRRPKWP